MSDVAIDGEETRRGRAKPDRLRMRLLHRVSLCSRFSSRNVGSRLDKRLDNEDITYALVVRVQVELFCFSRKTKEGNFVKILLRHVFDSGQN